MLNLLFTALTFAALCAICIYITRFLKIPSGAAPFTVLCAMILILTLTGCLGLLPVGAWLFYGFGIFCAVYCFITRKTASTERVLTPSFILFLLCGAGLLALLFARKPLMLEWDEYSLWSMAAKMTTATDTLYPAVQTGFPWAVSQKPGLIVLSYLFNHLGSFEPWRIYFGYDILMLSVFTAACAVVPRRRWNIAVPVFTACALILPFLNVYTRVIYMTTPYLNSYADIPMGIVMGGVFALYYAVCRNNTRLLLLPALGLSALTLCKDTGLPLALLCAAVICADILFLQKSSEFILFKKLRGLWAKLAVCFMYVFSVGASFFIWSKYLASLNLASNGLGGESNMTAIELVLNGLLMLFGLQPTAAGVPFIEKFSLVFENMAKAFVDWRITLFGTGVSVIGVVISLLLIAFALSANKLLRKRIVLFGALGTLGFIPYYCFIGFTYAFIFKGNSAVELIDYNRYVGCYYAGLLLMAAALLCAACADETRKISLKSGILITLGGLSLPASALIYQTITAGRKIPYLTDTYVCFGLIILFAAAVGFGYFKKCANIIPLTLGVLSLCVFSAYVPLQLSIVDFPDAAYTETAQVEKEVKAIDDIIPDGSRMFYISCADFQGKYWFMYHYYLYPNILDYSWGGGAFHDCAKIGDADGSWHMYISYGQLAAYLYESDNEYLILRDADSKFVDSYKELFKGEIKSGVYKINKTPGAIITDETPDTFQNDRPGGTIESQEKIRIMQTPEKYISLELMAGDIYE